MYLKRRIYDRLVAWKKESNLTLEVTGARQVGKTYIINNLQMKTSAEKYTSTCRKTVAASFWSV